MINSVNESAIEIIQCINNGGYGSRSVTTKVSQISEEDFLQLIRDINAGINQLNEDNEGKPEVKKLDESYLVKRFRELSYRERRKSFREQNGCKDCLYYVQRVCTAKKRCPLDDERIEEKMKHKSAQAQHKCLLDQEGKCPYGNNTGTCFGFCWKSILEDKKESNRETEE